MLLWPHFPISLTWPIENFAQVCGATGETGESAQYHVEGENRPGQEKI